MPVYSKQLISGSDSGIPITVSGTATNAAHEVHRVQATSTGAIESLWLWANNRRANAQNLVIRMISPTATRTFELSLHPGGAATFAYEQSMPVFEGLPLTATTTLIEAHLATGQGIGVHVWGYINRIATG